MVVVDTYFIYVFGCLASCPTIPHAMHIGVYCGNAAASLWIDTPVGDDRPDVVICIQQVLPCVDKKQV